MEEKFKDIRTPSEFYRSIRPEFFSDSEIIYEIKLTREILEFELSNISKNQKQDLFEAFSRRLAEKYISPNLIPQVGPTGGGDGKVDSETHPVSKFIAERWFISETNWDSGDKWAFAISAKTDWKGKVKSDVKKIVGTKRGYNQIFFFTNQAPSSKKKKECEKELKDEFNIDVTIIDREWMLEKVYTNNLQELAVTTLNLSSSYLSKKEVKGKNDKERNQRLEELELNISNPNRYFEYDLQLVEDALEAAILSRKLEKAKDEVIGKFNRAATFCEKTNNPKQWLRILYQKAFTLLNYYDDYEAFANSFIEFKSKFPEEPIFAEIELYNNLFNLLQGLLSSDVPEIGKLNIDIKVERKEFFEILEKAETNENFKTTSIIAKTYRLVQELVLILKEQNDLSKITEELSSTLKEGDKHLDYPFESIVKIIEHLGQVVPDDLNFDDLVDTIAEINSTRVSELSSGLTYFNRGRQKLLADVNVESVKYFGKAAQRLIKEDSQEELYLCLTGMAIAYKSLGLLWAANNCLYFAGSIAFKAWYQNGAITTRIKNIVHQLLVNELFIGRIPVFLAWNELYEIVRNQLSISSDEDIERPGFIDACLAVRLLNSHEDLGLSINLLPDILKSQTLHISEDTCSYILGLYDKLKADYSELEAMSSNEKIDEFFNKVYNQPFKDQMLYKTSLLDGENSTMQSIILGCTIKITFKNEINLLLLAEFYLAFFESFFSTSTLDIIPISEEVNIKLTISPKAEKTTFNAENTRIEIFTNGEIDNFNNNSNFDSTIELAASVLSNSFVIKNKEHLESLFKNEEISRRLSLTLNHFSSLYQIIGTDSKLFLKDWIKPEFVKYESKRTNGISLTRTDIFENEANPKKPDFDNKEIPHNKMKFKSIINSRLWDDAVWQAFGVAQDRFGLIIFLGFKNIDSAIDIFKEWKDKVGNKDEDDRIKISIIRGINSNQPNYYRVHVSTGIQKNEFKSGEYYTTSSRFHEMTPSSSLNLDRIIQGFDMLKWFRLVPAKIINHENGQIEPIFEYSIIKNHLHIRDAWQIGENDPDQVVIKKDDKPIIPNGEENPPIVQLLKKKNGA